MMDNKLDIDNELDDNIIELIVDKENCGKRLDIFIVDNTELGRSFARKLIDNGDIVVDGERKKSGYSTKINNCITITLPEIKEINTQPQDLDIEIVYQDKDMAVINKKQGMVVHPAPGSYDGTLVNALLFHLDNLSSINGVIRPGIVHRLDKDTSGLLVVAKNDKAHIDLQSQIASKSAKRYYIALVDGKMPNDNGIIETFIDRSHKDRKKMAVVRSGGRLATTHYKVLAYYEGYTLVEYELKTGRTHQIRVHSKHIGHPIVGDFTYGGSNKFGLKGQLLHAFKLVLRQPTTEEIMTFEAPLPDYFQNVLDKLYTKKI